MAWCLPPKQVDRFKNAILSRRIDPERLAEMSSAERRGLFARELGEENAEPINSQFESKLLLKNRQSGYISWAKKLLGENTPVGRDVISRVQRMKEVLSPADEKAFLEDLAAKRLGIHVTANEARKITNLSKAVEDSKAVMDSGGDRMAYGRAVVGLRDYVGDLRTQANKFQFSDLKSPAKALGRAIEATAGTAKSLKASLDNSAIFRQGWKALWTNPAIWQRNALKSFSDLVRQFGGKDVLNEIDADIVSRPTFDLMKRAKLDVGTLEEAYPSQLPEKIPGIGRAFKASEAAFTGFVRRTRADVFDKMIDIARKSDVELSDAELQSIGKMVNSLTGRGHLGRLEPAANAVNSLLFSPRLVKSHIDLLLQPLTGAGGSNFVRKQAALNLLKVISGTAAVLATARAVKKDSVELDPRSADFGKIRVGDSRFDVTGGMASLVTLASRLASMSTKSSVTGEVKGFNERDKKGNVAFGTPTAKDAVYNFFENKLSPAASVVKDVLQGHDQQGNKPTVGGEAQNLFEPLPITNYRELKNNPNSAPLLAGLIADALGISVNTYSASKKQGFVDRLRKGENVDLDSAVDSEQITKADRKAIEKDAQLTPFQSAFDKAVGDKALDRYSRMSEAQRAQVRDIMQRKAWGLTHGDSLTESEKAAFQKRLDDLGIEPTDPRKKANSFSGPSIDFRSRFMQGAHP